MGIKSLSTKARGKQKLVHTSNTRRASDQMLKQQIHVPFYALLSLLVMYALSSPSSLSLAHLSFHHLHLHTFLPTWLRDIPSLAQFSSELPNASHRGSSNYFSHFSYDSAIGQAGPFRSDARGFGHPLTALHTFTRSALGLSYPVADLSKSSSLSAAATLASSTFGSVSTQAKPQPWRFLFAVPGFKYERGPKDALYVATFVLIFTMLRAILMKYILLPLGEVCIPAPASKSLQGERRGEPLKAERSKALRSREKTVLRFAEQGFNLIYYSVSWSLGLYIASKQAYWPLNTMEYWTNYPETALDGLTKAYYLGECAFYIQQLFVLNVEARRSDHWQMFSHHVITIALIAGSYVCSFHKVGNAILCLMDPSDIFLSFAKMLKYSGLQTICDIAFGAFMISWMITRHVLYLIVIYSCMKESKMAIGFRPVNLAKGEAFSEVSYYVLVGLLWGLQVILCIWFGMIVRVAYRVLTKNGAVDSRSDEESSDEEDEDEELAQRLSGGDDPSGTSSGGRSKAHGGADLAGSTSLSRQASNQGGGGNKARRRKLRK